MSVARQCGHPLANAVQSALKQSGASVKSSGPLAWRIRDVGADGAVIRGRLDGDFLRFEFDPGRAPASDLWQLLQANAQLGGLVKFALLPDRRVVLRAELLATASTDWAVRLPAVWAGFAAGSRFFRQAAAAVEKAGAAPVDPGQAVDVAALCAETDWPYKVRANGQCSVTLETLRRGRAALVLPTGKGACVRAALAEWEPLAPVCREALADLLLSVSGLLRMARASVAEDTAGISAQLEAVFAWVPDAREVGSALGALSVGCDLCGAEAEVLARQVAAQNFLSVRGGPRVPEGNQQVSERNI